MISDRSQFGILEAKKGGIVYFNDSGKYHIVGIGNIRVIPFTYIKNILSVDN